jgi:hypothetical protein
MIGLFITLIISLAFLFSEEVKKFFKDKFESTKLANVAVISIGTIGILFFIICTLLLFLKWDEVTTFGRINLF